jgi:hypothetical protein
MNKDSLSLLDMEFSIEGIIGGKSGAWQSGGFFETDVFRDMGKGFSVYHTKLSIPSGFTDIPVIKDLIPHFPSGDIFTERIDDPRHIQSHDKREFPSRVPNGRQFIIHRIQSYGFHPNPDFPKSRFRDRQIC